MTLIDLKNEQVVSLTDATRYLPRRRAGRKPAVATLYRWASRGLRGVRLEVIRVGGTLCTSREALQRFCDALTDAPGRLSDRARGTDRSNDADRELAETGW